MSTNGPSSSPVFRRRILFTSLAGLAMAGGVGGYELHRAHRPPHKQPDGRYRKLTIAWPHATTAPVLAVAYQKDFFARYSLELETAGDFLDGSEALDALAHGKAAYAVAPALTWLPRLHAGLQASLVLGIQPGVFRLLVRRGSGVTRLDHLLNRPVGVPDLNAADKLFFAIMMRRKGINAMAGVNWKTLPAEELLGAVQRKELDAVVAHDPLAWQLLNQSDGLFAELVSSNSGHYADRTNLILGVSASAFEEDPDAATALTLALRDAAKWTNTHRSEAATLIADDTPTMTPDNVLAMLNSEPTIRPVTGHALREQMAQYCDELQLISLLPEAESAADLAKSYTRNVLRG
ncbi:ABC transporter substrate-binding protein [Acetobacter tropicalis]|uniref:ABC-type nitrate/sulfonate/bicarbonate transport system, periplasmic component n=1 Tax=Acetobacter tropicalis TaxID=104102 RepID=A0A094YQH7_9PROT|nr:ABC transporter substrate-binding protein [Acetobacter tropicalis]KAA8383363.1 ABC transporter substrate-binding protein [Acetobacter tropicalis]KAA8383859.1 ABC transporter substrate-binding protein [Acetobacter tropicalis]KGB22869.1 ABC-type nitrate/sulfonate/bicarbonate transport system, periplasmic component [Acetobacter tropicalis]MBC9009695.1 ABC transporter substrate-binding protein [Acetobacter tropicalis]MDO8170877.1 ABC transporter substrate-binding protein [Acetobacter tropicalis